MAERNPSGQNCRNCRFWRQFTGSDSEYERGVAVTGFCRRYPPWVTETHVEVLSGSPFELAEHVCTYPTAWCGEWQAGNPQTVDEAATVMARAVLAGDATAARALADKLVELVVLPPPEPSA